MDEINKELRLGATGDYPGGLQIGVTVRDGTVIIAFGKPIAWFGMDPDTAEILARKILIRAREARETGPGTWHDTKEVTILKVYLIPDSTNAETKITDGKDQLFVHLRCSQTVFGIINFAEDPLELEGLKVSQLDTGTLYIYVTDD